MTDCRAFAVFSVGFVVGILWSASMKWGFDDVFSEFALVLAVMLVALAIIAKASEWRIKREDRRRERLAAEEDEKHLQRSR